MIDQKKKNAKVPHIPVEFQLIVSRRIGLGSKILGEQWETANSEKRIFGQSGCEARKNVRDNE